MSETVRILTAMRELLSVPERWTQLWYAKTFDGHLVGSRDARATCWCLVGAAHKCSPDRKPAMNALHCLEETLSIKCIAEWQDDPNRTYAEVLAALDKAIELAGAAA